jgi:excisionase family DNA binding protein
MDNSEFMTISQAAQVIGRSRSSTYELAARGQIPAVRIGGSVRVPRVAFNRWIEGLSDEALRRTSPAGTSREEVVASAR